MTYPIPKPVLPAAALSLALAACGKADMPAPVAAPVEVAVLTLRPQPVAVTTELAGRATASLTAEVRPQVGGIIEKRVFREGSDVKAGDTLYLIAAAPFQAAADSAVAVRSKAAANLAAARSKANRYGQLAAIEAVSKQTGEDAVAALRQAEADLASADAALRAARVNLGFTRITAPISGRIGRSSVTQGALVTASQPAALAIIEEIDPIYVDVAQSSGDLMRLRREVESGKLTREADRRPTLRLRLEDGSVYPETGQLRLAEATVDPATGSITLRAVFANPRRDLLPGMYVRVLLQVGIDEQALVVPQPAITRDAKGNAVTLVVGPDSKVEQRTVVTAGTRDGGWIITSGLRSSERVIVAGVQKVAPGATVKTVEAMPVAASGSQR